MKRGWTWLCALALLLLCGCTGRAADPQTLSVCIDANGLSELFLGPILAEFEAQHPDVQLEVTYLPVYRHGDDAMLEARASAFTRTRTELMSGEGADVYLFPAAAGSSETADGYMLFPDLERNILSGAIHDLDFLFQDSRFDAAAYVSGLDAVGVVQGKAHVLPLSYRVYGLVGVDEALAASGFDGVQTDLATFMDQVLALGDRCPCLELYAETMLVNAVATPPVSVAQGEILLQTPQWQQALTLAREVAQRASPEEADLSAFLDYHAAAQAGAALLPGASLALPVKALKEVESMGYHGRFFPAPNENGGVTAHPYAAAVVSSGCQNLDAAADLLLFLLSDTVQGCQVLASTGTRANLAFQGDVWPVRVGCGVEMAQQLTLVGLEAGPVSDALAADIAALEDRIDTFRLASRYDATLYPLVEGYVNGSQTWQACWADLQSAWAYLDE